MASHERAFRQRLTGMGIPVPPLIASKGTSAAVATPLPTTIDATLPLASPDSEPVISFDLENPFDTLEDIQF